ncbi:MAG: hypothetical protein ACOY71_02345 [Gemmatimonadota bacterium]
MAGKELEGADLLDALEAAIGALGQGEHALLGTHSERLAALGDAIENPDHAGSRLRQTLAAALCGRGEFDLATAMVDGMPEGDAREEAEQLIENHRRIADVGRLSPLDEEFLVGDDSALRRAALAYLRTEGTTQEFMRVAATTLIDKAAVVDRLKLLGTFAPMMLLPMHALGGPAEMRSLIEGLEQWDTTFLEAARLIGEAA